MQPFDDTIPEEMDANNTAMIAFLSHVYVRDESESDTESKLADTEQIQAVVRVRERLLQLTQEQQSSISGMYGPTGGGTGSSFSQPQQAKSWQKRIKVLALVAMLVLLIASSFFITGLVQQRQLARGSDFPVTIGSYIVPPNKHGSLIVNELVQADQVSRFLQQKQQFTQINQSQMADGYQITVDKAYMDANILLLGVYAVMPYGRSANKDGRMDSFFLLADGDHTRLTANSVKLPLIGGAAGTDTSNIRHEQRGMLLAFDAAGIQGSPSQVGLNLQMDIHCQGWPPKYTCPHTLSFSLKVPFHANKQVATPQQAVTQNGMTFTLERVVITQAEARFYVGGWSDAMFQTPPWSERSKLESFDDTWYNIKLATASKSYSLCTLLTPYNCPQGAQTGPTLPRHNGVQFGGDGIGEGSPVYLNNDHTKPGFSLLEPFNAHGKMSVTITKLIEHFVKDKKNSDSYMGTTNGPVVDKKASPWAFEFILP
ncbi:hypothetical protein KSF_082260 [Reticulibacter mediterranei]|uniref:DUF4179 domain-containing protein n=1 Tax=Reticulibacter mediterranei TaxID=2778369 RepID=A0A8J3IQ69_9CHLR|nr:DUF4179 domain-containing protein [Reticulibacter mediterranei]GHO98178.1 hypothetical protein KSF_082260 [Reticulibacter mediterranei]